MVFVFNLVDKLVNWLNIVYDFYRFGKKDRVSKGLIGNSFIYLKNFRRVRFILFIESYKSASIGP